MKKFRMPLLMPIGPGSIMCDSAQTVVFVKISFQPFNQEES